MLLLCLLEREEEKALNKGAGENLSNERRKKHFIWLLPVRFGASYNRYANPTIKTLKIFLQIFFLFIPTCLFLFFLCFYFVDFVFHRYFARAMIKRFILQLYRTNIFLAQRQMTAYDHLSNDAIKKLSRWKIKATRLAKWLTGFFKRLEGVALGELQASNALQYRFKIFSGTTWINASQNGVCIFLIICRSSEIKHSLTKWLNGNSWPEIFTVFLKKAKKL